MPARKLQYDVTVDTGSAVRDLTRLGDAGKDAGRTIADGFDQAESASTQALRALSDQLDQLQSDAKGTADAVSAIKAELTIDVDDSKIAGFVTDLKTKMGVAFDDITADAKEFADVLARGVDLSRTTNEIRGVGDELDTVREHGDQSRSVLANLAGNAAQDLGELGGVVGSLGVGVGQLAEYAVDGNIAMSDLAGVAGPMLGLSAALALVQGAQAEIAAQDAFKAEQVDAYKQAVDDLGPSIAAVEQRLLDYGDAATEAESSGGALNTVWRTAGQIATDLIDNLNPIGELGGHITNVAAAFGSLGINYEQLAQVVAGGQPALDAFMEVLETNPAAEGLTGPISDFIITQQEAYAEAIGVTRDQLDDQTAAQETARRQSVFYADSIGGVEQALQDAADTAGLTNELWNVLMRDMADGAGMTEQGTAAWNRLKAILGLTSEQLAEQAQDMLRTRTAAKSTAGSFDDVAVSAGEMGDAFTKSAGAAHDIREVMAGADWGATSIDAANTAMSEFFTTAEAGKDAVAGVQEALDNLAEAHVTAGTILPDLSTGEGRAYWNALEQLGSSLIPEITQAFDDSRGSVDTFNQKMQGLYLRTLAQLSDQLDISTEDAALLLQQIGLVPENFSTQYELIGQADAQAKLALLQGAIDDLPPDVQTQVTMLIATGDYMGAVEVIKNYASTHPATVTTHANTGPANTEMAGWRNAQSSTPIAVRVDPWWSSLWTSPPVGAWAWNTATAAAPATSAAPAATAVAGDPMPATMLARPGRQVNLDVHVSAAVIGNRYEVERAVRGAVNDLVRLGRL